jgi:2,3,4,5-tetrahydropyridine-2-carboxylate N-succinyltransferase
MSPDMDGRREAGHDERALAMTSLTDLAATIDAAWEARAEIGINTKGAVRDAVEHAIEMLDAGEARVAEKISGEWVVHQWLKKAVLLSFRLTDNQIMANGPGEGVWWDKVPSKFEGWGENRFRKAGFRVVPPADRARSAYIAPGVVLMPSFVNVGAYVGSGTMVDTWATVGSCAQIGKNVHLSGGVGIGGVLEPLQANPTIIEDNCFIGARSEVVEGVIVARARCSRWACSSRPVDQDRRPRHRRDFLSAKVPPYSVVVAGSMPGKPFLNDGRPAPRSTAPSSSSCRRQDPLQDLDQRIAAGLTSD